MQDNDLQQKITILKGAGLLTMQDGPVRLEADLWLKEGKIFRIVPRSKNQDGIAHTRTTQSEAVQTEIAQSEILTDEIKQNKEILTETLDFTGCTILPGLIDAHVHYDESYMGDLFLAAGVTSVRNMRGYRGHALWRDEILAGKRRGPYLYSSGPVYDGEDPTIPDNDNEILHTKEDVEAAIAFVKENHFLWMKTYPSIEPVLYQYLLKRCREEGIPVCGHMTKKMDHAYLADHGYVCCEHTSSLPADPEKIRYLARRGMWLCPTHVVCETMPDYVWGNKQLCEVSHYEDMPECIRQRWEEENRIVTESYRSQNIHPDFQTIIDRGKAFLEVSGKIMAGTDCPYAGIVPGFSLADELERLVNVYGMSNYEALCAATCAPADHIGIEQQKGRIAPGLDADLVVLEGDPLADIGNVRRIRQVFQGTRTWDKEALRQLTAAVGILKKEEIEFLL